MAYIERNFKNIMTLWLEFQKNQRNASKFIRIAIVYFRFKAYHFGLNVNFFIPHRV